MPAMFAPIDDEVLTGFKKGDERALEKLFRANYDALLEEAKQQLNETGSAGRVVEMAVLRAWDSRSEHETANALENFLHGAVHEGAVRENSRRAGVHRLAEHEGVQKHRAAPVTTTSVDESWSHIVATLHAPPPTEKHMAQLKRQSRHAAAEHMAAVGKRPSLLKTLGLGAAAIAAVAALMFALFRDSPDKKATRMLASGDAREIISRNGQIGNLTLDDGSTALLGADSKLVIPPGFGTQVRAVRVVGTASFDVASDQEMPFEVRLGETAVLATGTKFAVNYDTASHVALVRVIEGSVETRNAGKSTPVEAGKAVAVTSAGAVSDATKAQIDEALAWTEGRLVVNDRPLRWTLEQVRRWYGLALMPSDASLLDRKVTVDAALESSTDLIADLEASGKLVFGWDDKTMMLYDVAHAPKAGKK